MAHIEILAVLLAASILTACGQAEPAEADPAVFENTAWKQSPEETEKALGQDFSKESPPREEVPEGELLNCLYNSPITLPVSGAEAVGIPGGPFVGEGAFLSHFAVGGSCAVTETGVEYPLEDYPLSGFYPLGVSNHILDTARITARGTLLVMLCRDRRRGEEEE